MTILGTHRLPGLVSIDHAFELPLVHDDPSRGSIEVFARELRRPSGGADRPLLVFLQGGPGFEAPRPETRSGWLDRALESYRVLLLDQRGTGRSSPLDARVLAALGDDQAIADHLVHFRADSIVRDCEAVRRELAGGEPWSVLGQSFGGFCATTYLGLAPEGLSAAFITGGLPPLDGGPDPVYDRTIATLRAKTRAYHERYPEDAERLRAIAERLERTAVELPGGDRLTPRRLQSLGIQLGFRDGPAKVHYLLERAWSGTGANRDLAYAFLRGLETIQSFDTNPLYALVHEPCYAQGAAANWSAQRAVEAAADLDPSNDPFPFTGEMVFRWTFEESAALRPLLGAAERLAERDDWGPLYDPDALARNDVPVAAAVYANDMFVDRELSLATAAAIRGCRPWLTDEYEHCGLRVDGERVLGRLIDLATGEA